MKTKSRTENSAKNTTVAVISQMSAILAGYIVRIVFTRSLSQSYVGVSGLFSDIINILSLTELGLGTAITYALYKPIKDDDFEKQKSLMRLFRQLYRGVAGIVLGAGLCLIPFMNSIIKDKPDIDHLILIYIIYLLNAAGSYLLIYKKTLIDAHQLSYIGTAYQTVCWLVQDAIQIAVLIYTKNFILYLLINSFSIMAGNILISRKADKMYPFLRDKNVQPLPGAERKAILKNIGAMLMHKIGSVAVNNTDNLLLSAFVGIADVGRYSNYYLIIGSVQQLLTQVFSGVAASVGNLGVSEGKDKIKRVFEEMFFVTQWMYGVCAIVIYEVITPFVAMSFGDVYRFTDDIVLVLCAAFYIKGMRNATLVFRDSFGLFYYDRYKAVAEAALNLVISVVLVHYLGTAGVFLGTILSTLLTGFWVEPYILYKHSIQGSVWSYFGKYTQYLLVEIVCFFATDYLGRQFQKMDVSDLLIRGGIALVVPNVIMLVFYCRTKQFRNIYKRFAGLLEGKSVGKGKKGD